MAAPLRQSSFWLGDETTAQPLVQAQEQRNLEKHQQPQQSRSELPFQDPSHTPSGGLDFLDEYGKDRRIGVASSTGSDEEDALPQQWFSWRKLWLFTGPGFLMSIAYLVSFHKQNFCRGPCLRRLLQAL